MAKEFRETSIKFNNELPKSVRQEGGIYFTPKKLRDRLFSVLERFDRPATILEPSFGSGEFLLDAQQAYPDAIIYGVEKNEKLYNSVVGTEFNLVCSCFLEWSGDGTLFDLIVGNPPYFVMKLSAIEKKKFVDAMTGRPNIYIMFLYKCLTAHLNVDGIVAFIIPTSLCNCSYYSPLREYIYKNATILHLEFIDKAGFYETGQDTMLIVIQNGKKNDDYIFKSNNGNIYISPYYKELYDICKDSITIKELGLGVKTGNIVWNQHKEKLCDEEEDGTLLIYSSNIKNYVLEFDNLNGNEKKQYIRGVDKPKLSGRVILVERGFGNSYKFNFVVVDLDIEFYAENHLNVIYKKNADGDEALDIVSASFNDSRTKEFIKMFIGNGSCSASDIECIIPIFRDTIV